jgi:hypothetical protein
VFLSIKYSEFCSLRNVLSSSRSSSEPEKNEPDAEHYRIKQQLQKVAATSLNNLSHFDINILSVIIIIFVLRKFTNISSTRDMFVFPLLWCALQIILYIPLDSSANTVPHSHHLMRHQYVTSVCSISR